MRFPSMEARVTTRVGSSSCYSIFVRERDTEKGGRERKKWEKEDNAVNVIHILKYQE